MVSIRKKLMTMVIFITLLSHPLIQAQQKVQKKLSELKEGSVFCYFSQGQKLTNKKENSTYYRKLIKKNVGKNKRSYIIQDFFSKTDKKQVDPVTLMDEKDLYSFSVGSIDGLYIQWYSNGKKELETVYDKGKLQGEYTRWYNSGTLASKNNYLNDELDGTTTIWNESGIKVREVSLSKGKRNGLTEEWRYDGSKELHVEFKDGQKHGSYMEWSNDKPVLIGQYENGKREGKWSWWDANSNKVREGFYKNDREEGIWTIWNNSGVKLQEITYKDGHYDGLLQRWDYKGNLIRREMYKNGSRTWSMDPFSLKGL